MSESNCTTCGRHRDWGCAFDCSERKAPADQDTYRVWADEQQRHYANGETPGELRNEEAA